MNKKQQKIIAVVGPTGSGKTGLGVKLAKEFDGEIISADSRQVYRGLDLGTGKDLGDLKDVKYHLIDIKDPEEEFTLFDWLKDARKIIDEIFTREKTPIVVGGTGLYVQGLVEGFKTEKDTRNKSTNKFKIRREKLEGKNIKELKKIAVELDIDTTNIDIKNPYRLIRVIEKHQNQELPTKNKPDFEALLIASEWSQEELYERIDKRLDQRFKAGMLEEVIDLIDQGIDADWLLGLGLDYKVMTNYILNSKLKTQNSKIHIKDQKAYEEMVHDLKTKEHQYAKRQLTWWKRFDVKWIKDYEGAKELVNEFISK